MTAKAKSKKGEETRPQVRTKIQLSKISEKWPKKHVVLTCSIEDGILYYGVILDEVLEGKRLPTREIVRSRGMMRYRFPLSYLDKVKLTFPQADISMGLDRRLIRQARKEYEAQEIPKVKISGFGFKLKGYQKVFVKWWDDLPVADETEDEERFVGFLNDEMGLGKTVMALAVIVRRLRKYKKAGKPFKAIAVVPNGIKYTAWAADAAKAAPWLKVAVIDSDEQTPAQRADLVESDYDLLVVNFESLWRIPAIAEQHFDLMVIDEYHRMRNPTTNQSQGIISVDATDVLFMSGTQLMNGKIEEIWASLHKAWPKRYPNYYLFRSSHAITDKGKIIAYSGLVPLKESLEPYELRRRKDQVLKDLPPMVFARQLVTLTKEQRKLYNEIRDDLIVRYEDGSIDSVLFLLSQITRLKQAAWSPELYGGSRHSAKLDALSDLLSELRANNEKAIVFSQWSKATRILLREFGDDYNAAYIDGKVPTRKRAEEIARFQNDEDCKLFIGTIGSCKEGMTLTAASYVIFTDKGWTPAENDQAAARAHRIGQEGTVTVVELFAQGTIEADIEDMIQSKRNVFNAWVDKKDGGVRNERITLKSIMDLL